MYEDFLERYSEFRGISKEEALELALVKEVMKEKDKRDEMSQVRNGYDYDR